MRVGRKKLKMSSGEIRTLKSEAARERFERIAKAIKYGGFKPTKKKKKR